MRVEGVSAVTTVKSMPMVRSGSCTGRTERI